MEDSACLKINDNVDAFDAVAMLGQPLSVVFASLGQSFGSYHHRGRDIHMFSLGLETLTCEVESGVVVRVNTYEERRTSPRIKPDRVKRAFLRHGSCRHEALVLDLSAKSIALKIKEGCLPQKGEFVTFCTSLRKRPFTRSYVVLFGHVHSVVEAERKIIILFYVPYETHSYKVLLDYISTQQAMGTLKYNYPALSGKVADNRDVEITKSDLCLICDEGACGFSYAALKNKAVPFHRGVHDRKQ